MLCSLPYLKNVLAVPDGSQDAQLAALLQAADAAVKSYCNRDLEQQTYTQYYSGNNTQRFCLKQTPVTQVANLWLDNSGYFDQRAGEFTSLNLLLEGQDWVLDRDVSVGYSKSGIVFRIGTVWPVLNRINTLNRLTPDQGPTWGNIKVTYTAGFSPVPADLQYATALVAAFMKRTVKFGGYMASSERLGDYAYTLLTDPRHAFEVGTVLEILGRYREIAW